MRSNDTETGPTTPGGKSPAELQAAAQEKLAKLARERTAAASEDASQPRPGRQR